MKHTLSVWGTLLMVLAMLVSSCQKEVLLPIEEGASHKSSPKNANNTTVTHQAVTLPTEFCGDILSGDLMSNGGSSFDGGDYQIFNDETYLYVVMSTDNAKKNFHASIKDCLTDLQIGGEEQNGIDADYATFAFVLSGLPNSFCLELKAVGKVDVDNNNYSANIAYTVQYCCEISMNDFGIVGHGGWGADAQGNNWGTYLNANYANIAPITIGCATGEELSFANAAAIRTYQRTTPNGTPGVLQNAGVLGKQVMALALNIAFDDHDANFGASNLRLGDLKVANGILAGKTVDEVLVIANDIVGGCSTAYSPSAINEVVSSINDKEEGFLTCPN